MTEGIAATTKETLACLTLSDPVTLVWRCLSVSLVSNAACLSLLQIFSARVRVDSTAKVSEIEAAERKKMKDKVDKILAHGMNCFINRQLIYNYPEQVWNRDPMEQGSTRGCSATWREKNSNIRNKKKLIDGKAERRST